ncbi:MAG: chitosanase [Ferruginibacter sp.]
MTQLIVKAKKLNIRNVIPSSLPDAQSIIGVVNENSVFEAEEVIVVPNPALGKWYKDKNNHFYWGGGVEIVEDEVDENSEELSAPDNAELENILITSLVKRKIERVINAFETGAAEGNYATLVKLRDFNDPETKTRIAQVTYGRSQTTEFGHLKALVQDYINSNGSLAEQLSPFVNKIGKKPSLATEETFCNALKNAGKNDPIMKTCQDHLFETKYYQPAHNWFSSNGFTLPLSLLVIYDSFIHSGSILTFLRKKFNTIVPANGGNEKEWISNYVEARHNWLANHPSQLLRNTVYRTNCFKEQLHHDNWDLAQTINAHGVTIV